MKTLGTFRSSHRAREVLKFQSLSDHARGEFIGHARKHMALGKEGSKSEDREIKSMDIDLERGERI